MAKAQAKTKDPATMEPWMLYPEAYKEAEAPVVSPTAMLEEHREALRSIIVALLAKAGPVEKSAVIAHLGQVGAPGNSDCWALCIAELDSEWHPEKGVVAEAVDVEP